MARKTPAERQAEVLQYIREASESGIPPSVREICSALSIKSTSTVHTTLNELEELGHIIRDARNSRAIRLAGANRVQQVPVLGKVTAGQPILATEHIDGYIPVSDQSGKELFALKVKGLSMKNAGILDGDYVVSEHNPSVVNGDIVIALIEDEATVKRYFFDNGTVRLQPENDDFEPIVSNDVRVIGKVVSLVRNY